MNDLPPGSNWKRSSRKEAEGKGWIGKKKKRVTERQGPVVSKSQSRAEKPGNQYGDGEGGWSQWLPHIQQQAH